MTRFVFCKFVNSKRILDNSGELAAANLLKGLTKGASLLSN
jgi:hypothetical protein